MIQFQVGPGQSTEDNYIDRCQSCFVNLHVVDVTKQILVPRIAISRPRASLFVNIRCSRGKITEGNGDIFFIASDSSM